MRIVAYCLSFCALIVLFSSCQPEPDDTLDPPTPPPVPPPTVNDSIYLRMMVSIDTTFPSGMDTSDKAIFYYDALKRLDSINYYTYYTGVSGDYDHNFQHYFYTGTDTLPYKITFGIESDPGRFYRDTVYLKYQNGVVVYDSAIAVTPDGFSSTGVRYFRSHGNGKYSQASYGALTGHPFTFSDSIISLQTYQNGNLITQYDSSIRGLRSQTQKSTREFDSHIDPTRRFNVPYPIVTSVNGNPIYNFFQQAISTNNETKLQIWQDGIPAGDYANNFQYRADGYPLISRQYWDGFKLKVYYYYQK